MPESEQQTQHARLLAEAIARLGEGVMITSDDLDWPGPEIVFVNEAMCRISGYAAEELVGQTPRILQGGRTEPDTLQQVRNGLARGDSVSVEGVNYRKDGTPYDAEVFITPLIDTEGARTHYVAIHRDITERKRKEKSLYEREQWMRTILNTASDAILTIDQHGIITSVNPATERMFGYAQDELIGQSLGMLLPPSPAAHPSGGLRHGAPLPQHLATDEAYALGGGRERLARCKDGATFPVELSLNKIDHLAFFTVILRDISDRRNAEQALRETEQRFELAIRGAADGIWDWPDMQRNEMWWSPRFYRLLGYEPGEVPADIGNIRQRIHPDDVDRVLGAAESHFAANVRFDVECRLQKKTGKYRWFRGRAAVLRDEAGKPRRMTGCLEDIDRRKGIEESLRREHELSENIIDTAPAIVLVVNPQGRIVRFNRFLERLTQWKAEDVRGKDWFEAFIRPEHRKAARKRFKKAIAGECRQGGLGTVVTKEGREHEIQWYDAPLTGERGELVGLLCTGQDITERRMLEREVLEIATDEQRRIGHDLHDGVCQELTGLGLLAQGLADELGELHDPSALNHDTLPRLQEVTRKLADGLDRAGKHSRALSHGLIPVDVDAQGLLAALKELATSIGGGRAVSCRMVHDTPVELSDNFTATHLYRVAQEAVANALRHSRAEHIQLALTEMDERVVLTITDDGVGMTEREQRCGGMGLRIMQYRADIIGATLDIRSSPHGGTIIRCQCPKHPPGQPA